MKVSVSKKKIIINHKANARIKIKINVSSL